MNQIRCAVTKSVASFCFFALAAPPCGAESQLCDLQWVQQVSGVISVPGIPLIRDLVVFDDGVTGPALYAGGGFFVAGGIGANNIAKWNGSSWSPLAAPLPAGLHEISAMCVFDDGSGPALHVAAFVVGAQRVAKWDGSTWTILAGEFNMTVHVLRSVDMGAGPTLYVGGRFSLISGQPRRFLARWTGTEWAQVWSTATTYLSSSPFLGVHAIEVFDEDGDRQPEMFVGGAFHAVDGVVCTSLAKWDGSVWSGAGPLTLGGGDGPGVGDLVVHDDGTGGGPALFAAGRFKTIGGVTANSIAKWDGEQWTPLDGGLQVLLPGSLLQIGVVYRLLSFADDPAANPRLFAGGHLSFADGIPVASVARWDGRAWSSMGLGTVFVGETALAGFDDGSPLGPAVYINSDPLGPLFGDSQRFAKWQRVKQGGPADLDCDAHVSAYDLAMLLGEWGDCPPRGDCPADLDGDGIVNGVDLAMLLSEWG